MDKNKYDLCVSNVNHNLWTIGLETFHKLCVNNRFIHGLWRSV